MLHSGYGPLRAGVRANGHDACLDVVPVSSPAASTTTGVAPGEVTLKDIGGNAPVYGTAGFTLQGGDVAMLLKLTGTDQLSPFPDQVSVWIMPGTCAEQTQPLDVSSAIAKGSGSTSKAGPPQSPSSCRSPGSPRRRIRSL